MNKYRAYVCAFLDFVAEDDKQAESVGAQTLIRKVQNDEIAISVWRAPGDEPAHTDHPLRHFDRTCPGCQAEHDGDNGS